jgi:glycosyltransferase involved in cell wall biosynthesis
VSVVTPVYNGETHLEECIESVRRQTWTNWEYVIADNASSDRSAAIAERHAREDPRIRVHRSTEFVDIWSNHNRALGTVHPDSLYCKVLQADDVLYPECLERMVEAAGRHPSAGIVSSYRLLGDSVLHSGLFAREQTVMPGREVLRRILLATDPPWPDLGWVMGSPSSLLIRHDLIRARPQFYDVTFWHADADASLRSMLSSDCAFVHQVLTFTRMSPSALSPFSYRVNSFLAEQGWLLLRYGAEVLTDAELRAKSRKWLLYYVWLVLRRSIRPYQAGFEEFRRFHARDVERMLAEAAEAPAVRSGLRACAAILRAAPRFRRAGR